MKPMNSLSYDEEDVLRRILRHHDVLTSRKLVDDIGALIEWVRSVEQNKVSLGSRVSPQPLLVLLSTLGIYGGEAIGPSPQPAST